MKKSPYPRIALSIILFTSGFIAHALLFRSKPPRLERSVAVVPSQKAEIHSLNTELAELQTAYASLQTQIGQPAPIKDAHFSEGITISSDSASGVVAMPFSSEHFQDMMNAQVNRQLDIYTARLNLSQFNARNSKRSCSSNSAKWSPKWVDNSYRKAATLLE